MTWIDLNNYISKDKIKEYREKFKNALNEDKVFITQSNQISASLIAFCNELLGEDK